MKKYCSALLIAAMTLIAYLSEADSRNAITGQIINSRNKEKIPFLNISIKGTAIGTTTNEEGRFTLSNVAKGTYVVVVSGVGYRRVEKTVDVASNVPIVIETEE